MLISFFFRLTVLSDPRRRPTGLCCRIYSQDIYLLCSPPLVITTAAAVHPHYIFVDEFADRVSGDCTCCCSGKDPQQTSDCGADSRADETADDGTGLTSGGCCYKAARACSKQRCSSASLRYGLFHHIQDNPYFHLSIYQIKDREVLRSRDDLLHTVASLPYGYAVRALGWHFISHNSGLLPSNPKQRFNAIYE